MLQGSCGCDAAVTTWTTREIRALRQALRLPMRGFATHLGVAMSAVVAWERKENAAKPRGESQAKLANDGAHEGR